MKDLPDTPAELKQRALRYLVRREHSRAELERKLSPHADSRQAVETVLDLLSVKKQQSDERFAAERARVLARKFGPAKIRQDLKARGIAEELIERLPGTDELEHARLVLEKRFRSKSATREERARRARFLQGRGFSSEVIHRLLLRGED